MLFVAVCVSAVVLVVTTIDAQDDDLTESVRSVPHSIDLDKIIDGGPLKDGIPSINNPVFAAVSEADSAVDDNSQVLVAETENGVEIFPLNILLWHQIINDTASDPPIVATYDPFIDRAAVYQSVYQGRLLTFGVSGKLFESNMLMYDRQTNSLWHQFNGRAVVGDMTGSSLLPVKSSIMPWKYAKKKFPDAKVLSRETGFDRNYDEQLYDVYFKSDKLYFDISNKDTRYGLKKTVYGIEIGGKSKAYPDELLDGKWLLLDTFNDNPLLILKNPQTGVVKVFKTYVYGTPLEFELKEDGFLDTKYGAKWNFDGACVEGTYKGWRLQEIENTRAFWFAWSNFHPDTEILF